MRVARWVCLGAILVIGCSASADATDDGGALDGGDGPPCPGQTQCGAECVSLTRDPQNCGACGRACALGQMCHEGVCADAACDGGTCAATVTRVTSTAPSAACPGGGVVVHVGVDDGSGGGVARDGVLQDGEVVSTTHRCNPYCGDGTIDPQYGEVCDEGAANGTGSCTSTCVAALDCAAYPTPQGCPPIDYAVRAVAASGATTAGGFPITLSGTLPTSGAVAITMGGAAIVPTSADASSVVFQAPAGVGSVPITLTVGGTVVRYASATVTNDGVYQPVLADAVPFSYPRPTVSSVTGCASSDANGTLDCSPSGGTVLTITGANFGVSAAGVSVAVGGAACSSVALVVPQTALTCTLPAGVGYDLPVVVTVGGAASSGGPTVSYAGPVITNVSHPPGAAIGGEIITVDGTFPGIESGTPTVTLYADDVAQSCGAVTVESPSRVHCTLPAGGGTNLGVVITVGGAPSRRFASNVSYAPPVIHSGTLRSSANGPGSPALLLSSGAPQRIYFDATNLGPDPSYVRVFYGRPEDPRAHRCTNVSFTASGLSCITEAGYDSGNVFRVSAYGQESNPGADTLAFPQVAAVTKISGCSDDNGARTSSCPASGGVSIELTLSSSTAIEPVLFTVGGRACVGASWIMPGLLRCTLPPGGGVPLLSLSMAGSSARFAEGATLDYALPSIARVSGCQDVEMTTIGCAAGGTVTIAGQNFGPAGDVVLVGGKPCIGVTHDPAMPDSRLTCVLPAGGGMNQEVRVLDVSGRSSNVLHLSYAP